MNQAKRIKFLIENYVEARISGINSGYDIRQVSVDNYEHYYILINPKAGVYKGHNYVLEMKTRYGHDNDDTKYPINAPYMHFITNIFHVNISPIGGAICLDMLKDKSKWSSMNSFDTIIQNILLLFDEPNTSSPFNAGASAVWTGCSILYKQHGTSKLSVEEDDKIRETCFKKFNNLAIDTMNTNKLKEYSLWFPQLDINHVDYNKRINDDIEHFAELKSIYDDIQEKRKNRKPDEVKPDEVKPDEVKPDEVKPDEVKPDDNPIKNTTKNKNRWSKYQK